MLTLNERIWLYEMTFPEFEPLQISKSGRINGVWIMGNNYRTKGGYGAYPAGFVSRVTSMFPDKKRMLHLFSTSIVKGPYDRFDCNPRCADIVGDAHELSKLVQPGYDLILCDPPYSVEDCDHYGTAMVRRNEVIEECLKVLAPGGFLVWLDQVFPMFRKVESPAVGFIYVRQELPDGLDDVGEIGMIKSTNHRVRAVFMFRKAVIR